MGDPLRRLSSQSGANKAAGRALVALALVFGCGVFAAAADDMKLCLVNEIVATGSPALEEACARLIESGKLRGKQLALAYNNRAVSLSGRGEFKRALQEQNEAIRLWPDNIVARGTRASIYVNLGDYDRALADLDDAVRSNPKDAWNYTWRGRTYAQKGDYTRALIDLDKSVRLNPKDTGSYYWRGWVYTKTKDYDRAVADFTRAIGLDPPNPAVFYFGRCQANFLNGDYDRALPDCNEAIERAPTLGGSFVARCAIYAAKGDLDRGLRDCDDDIVREPKRITNRLWRGFIYERKGELAKAIADYQAALAVDPTNQDTRIPPAIGATLDDVRAHLANVQGQAAKAAAANSPGPDHAASTPAKGDARALMEKHGLLGVWALNCSAAASQQNPYTVFRALDDRHVQRDVMTGPSERKEAGIVETAAETGSDLAYTFANETRTLRIDGNRMRVAGLTRDGTKLVSDGKHLASLGNAALTGTDTPWISKCQ